MEARPQEELRHKEVAHDALKLGKGPDEALCGIILLIGLSGRKNGAGECTQVVKCL